MRYGGICDWIRSAPEACEHARAVPAQAAFRLGVFSSASERTVSQVIPMLEAAAGPGPPLFDTPALVLTRAQTNPAPHEHVAGGGDPWDTVKPLGRYFPDLSRVILVDDDHWKVRGAHSVVLVAS